MYCVYRVEVALRGIALCTALFILLKHQRKKEAIRAKIAWLLYGDQALQSELLRASIYLSVYLASLVSNWQTCVNWLIWSGLSVAANSTSIFYFIQVGTKRTHLYTRGRSSRSSACSGWSHSFEIMLLLLLLLLLLLSSYLRADPERIHKCVSQSDLLVLACMPLRQPVAGILPMPIQTLS